MEDTYFVYSFVESDEGPGPGTPYASPSRVPRGLGEDVPFGAETELPVALGAGLKDLNWNWMTFFEVE